MTSKEGKPLRSLLLGAYTKRGMGVSAATRKYAETLLPLIHRVAATRPNCAPYSAVQVNEYVQSGCPTHRDRFNSGESWVLGNWALSGRQAVDSGKQS